MTPGEDEPDDFEVHSEHLRLLNDEVDRQRLDVSERANSGLTRASILIAAAGITIGATVDQQPLSSLGAVAMTISVLAAVCGVAALWPRAGVEHSIEGMIADTWSKGGDEAAFVIMHRKIDILKGEERLLHDRSRWVRTGYLLFGVSLVVLLLASAIY